MKILITGANGYLGQGIVKAVLETGNEVIATDFSFGDRKAACALEKNPKYVEADLFTVKDPYTYFGCPDALLHLAWRDGFVHYSDAHIDDLPEHYAFIKSMIKAGCGHIAVMGSMHEIGFFEGSINENTPCNPVTPYGVAKNALRELTQVLCQKNNCVFQWLRGFYIVGNTGRGSSVFSKLVQAAQEGKKEFPFTLGQNQYDFIDYEDFCTQTAAVVTQQIEQGIINICSGRPEKLADRMERFIRENKFDVRLKYGAFPDRPYDSRAIWGNSRKIEKIMSDRQEKK